MSQIDVWLQKKKKEWQADFLGLAQDVAPPCQQTELRWRHVAGNTSDHYKTIRLRIGKGIAGEVWRTGREQRAAEIQSDSQNLLKYPIARLEKLDTTIGIPIMKNGIIQAVLLLGYRHPIDSDLADMTAVYAALPGLAALLEEEGHKDE
ncbi:GAF domain-containing protein [uncultured Trichococcus sp.]|uniref:GAF domain-containing protein n=1 Tax=uncultured Trichococcus sp. TaxID=189665 RepID=UPI002A18A751|nr:GAF domain-containing protein [uncultured Trichococcus sp.]